MEKIDSSHAFRRQPTPWNASELACNELPTQFQPQIGKILVTGASGYIGGSLVPELLSRGYNVRVMVRAHSREYNARWPSAEIVVADALKPKSLETALQGIATAYYLIHSLALGPKEFSLADMQAAENFRQAAARCRMKRIIYLGGLGDAHSSLSPHLRGREEVARELQRGIVPVTILRAAIIVGAGSASYEIIHYLVKRLRVVLIPYWARNQCQPIAVRDVIKYLVGILEVSETTGKSFDIGGKDILTYEMMLMNLAELLRKKVFFVPVPFSNISFYAYITSLITPVPKSITECLMRGLLDEVICRNASIKQLVPFEPLSYRTSIVRAMTREEQDKIHTRWSDAYPPAHELAIKFCELEHTPGYQASSSLKTAKEAPALFKSICKIGGKEGWFHSNWLWRLRGLLDRMLLGVGTARGRKSQSTLRINDVIDFWRIEDLEENRRLLLRAEMKLSGRAWLEFRIGEEKNFRELTVTAYYETQSLWGRIYWHLCFPFHYFIFFNLIKEIEKRS